MSPPRVLTSQVRLYLLYQSIYLASSHGVVHIHTSGTASLCHTLWLLAGVLFGRPAVDLTLSDDAVAVENVLPRQWKSHGDFAQCRP
eukprot:687452-Amphidinium_carterae.2